jgi:stress-induced morphogen
VESQEMLAQITAAFQSIIQELDLHPTRLDIELTISGYVHVYMTAPEFSDKTEAERDLMIWRALETKLTNSALTSISVCILMAPEEETETLNRVLEYTNHDNDKASANDNDVDGKMTPLAIFDKIISTFNKIIQERHIHPTRLDFELTPYETVHIYMEAPEFSGKTGTERDLMIWPALEKRLPEDVIVKISACVLLEPEDEPETLSKEELLAA